jgi:hypothetical protein
MHEVQVDRPEVLGDGSHGELRIEGIARLEQDELPRLGSPNRLDRWVIAVEAVGVVDAVRALLLDVDP